MSNTSIDKSLLSEAAEIELSAQLEAQAAKVVPLFDAGQYGEALASLAALHQPVDQFFDDVMVMVDDEAIKNNRLALLNQLRGLFLRVADISLLSK